jgi:coenzyme F420-reducing hydrogenase alpha subunit
MTNRVIKVDALARVEGEGSLFVRVKDKEIKEVRFGIFEPPRFFEAFLQGRSFMEVPDITARICGICPIAYQMGSIQAMENAFGIEVPKSVRDLRRLIYCGEWIESHALHVYMLHAPDFLGLADAIQLAKSNRALVEKALRLKKIGNDILEVIGGGRAIHPVNMRVGGFFRTPRKAEVQALIPELEWAIEASRETIKLVGGFDFPNIEQNYTFVALRHDKEYAIHEGRVVSNRGLDIALPQFLDHFDEEHVKHSNALHGFQKPGKQPYNTGPLARYAINYDKLNPDVQAAAKAVGLDAVVRNPFKSIVVRAVELLQVCLDGLEIAKSYEEPKQPYIEPQVKAAVGHGCTEAPRGICFHRYEVDDAGLVKTARIMPPTAQNQKQIESDLFKVVEANLSLSDEDLKWRCEQAIRNYDPCISCATHFLKLTVERE